MTIAAEVDERVPPIVIPEYESYPHVYWVNDRLIIFRDDMHITAVPQCVARLPSGDRCAEELPFCGFSVIQVVGSDASVEARITSRPDCHIRQRCPEHVQSGGEDVVPPGWEPFDPERDVDALLYIIPRWSPTGVWVPPEHGSRQRLQIWHQPIRCGAGDHVPLVSADDDEDDWEDDEQEDAAPAMVVTRLKRRRPPTPPAEAEIVEIANGVTALYRYYDADDLLLYVGISDHLVTRTGSHIKASSWMDFAARSTIERHPTRAVALTAEEAAIKAEHPLFNHQHNDTPEARRRLVEYLIKRDRLDLLAPAVSRG